MGKGVNQYELGSDRSVMHPESGIFQCLPDFFNLPDPLRDEIRLFLLPPLDGVCVELDKYPLPPPFHAGQPISVLPADSCPNRPVRIDPIECNECAYFS